MTLPRFLPRDSEALIFLVVTAPLAAWLGIILGQPIVLPLLTALPAIVVFVDRMNSARPGGALGLMIAWSAASSLSVILLTQWNPAGAEAVIWRGAPYRDEMLRWIHTGAGKEGSVRLFLPEHVAHYVVFLVASALTGGVAGLVLGSILLNYMSFYVGSLFLNDAGPDNTLTLALMGWPIWAIARVIGFIAGGVAMAWLTRTVFQRLRDQQAPWPGRASHYLSLSLALVILDALLKALLAHQWQVTLQGALSP